MENGLIVNKDIIFNVMASWSQTPAKPWNIKKLIKFIYCLSYSVGFLKILKINKVTAF